MKKHAKHLKAKHTRIKSRKSSKKSKVNGASLRATELLRDLINLIAVYKEEELQDVTTRIDPDTADELVKKLEQLAKAL